MISETQYGAFRGGKLIQQRGQIGGARSVFVKVKGIKNELVYPPFGGKIMNPPKGQGFKMFAGDLAWFMTDNDGIKPEVYLLKTYEVKSASEDLKTVNIVKDGYRHRPFVGDKLGVAPNAIGGSMTAATIVSITTTKVGEVEVYACVFDSAVTGAAAGKILVEADSENKMLVKKINAVLDSDIDLLDAGAESSGDFENARYHYTPALGGLMYIRKMSPMPACVLALNESKINGWFKVQSV